MKDGKVHERECMKEIKRQRGSERKIKADGQKKL